MLFGSNNSDVTVKFCEFLFNKAEEVKIKLNKIKMKTQIHNRSKDGGAFSLMQSNRNFLIQNVYFLQNQAKVIE